MRSGEKKHKNKTFSISAFILGTAIRSIYQVLCYLISSVSVGAGLGNVPDQYLNVSRGAQFLSTLLESF